MIEEKTKTIGDLRAKEILQEWLDYYDIEFDDIVNEQGKEGAETAVNKLKRAIRNGRLEIEEDPEKGLIVIQHTKKTVIKYGEISGKSKMEADKHKGNHSRLYAILGSLSGLGVDAIAKLKGKDLGLAECIAVVFLVV
jgi:hypothetical protein